MNCSEDFCKFDTYDESTNNQEEEKKCIFHISKEDWNEETEKEHIDYFWEEFNKQLKDKDNSIDKFEKYIFPIIVQNTQIESIDKKIEFSNCEFYGSTELKATTEAEIIIFKNCKFNNELTFINIENEKKFTLLFEKPLPLKNNNFSIVLDECKNIDFSLRESKNLLISLKNTSFIKLKLLDSEIEKLDFDNLEFLEKSSIILEFLKVKNLSIKKISQESKFIQFNNINTTNSLVFEKIELKNTYFNEFDLRKVSQKTSFKKVSFIESKINSIYWKNLEEIEANQEFFRELKFVYDSQANFIEANKFYNIEMKYALKQSSYKRDKILLLSNKLFSDFGQNWTYPVYWLILMLFIHFLTWYGYKSGYGFQWANFINEFVAQLPLHKFLSKGFELLSLIYYIFYLIIAYHLIISLKRITRRN